MWRSLAEHEGSEEFQEWLEREFPEQAETWAADETSRREFLRLMAASLALAGATGCGRQPVEQIVPTVRTPEHAPGGPPLMYASAMPMTGGALGILVETREHRPIKIEGNEQHPASLGATDIFAQAAVLGLYDPDRSQVVRKQGQISTWAALLAELTRQRVQWPAREGRGLRILSPPVLSPTLTRQRDQLLEQFPQAHWHEFEPVDDASVREGTQLAFGEPVRPIYHVDQADVILSIDANFLADDPGSVAYARQFAARRNGSLDEQTEMNRLYVVESTPSLTGAKADHRLSLAPDQIEDFVRILAARLGIEGSLAEGSDLTAVSDGWWNAVIEDLTDEARRPLVLAGRTQSPAVHALVHVLNDRLGATGETVTYVDDPQAPADEAARSIAALVEDMRAGEVESLFILESNPVFSAPADLEFAEALAEVSFACHLGLEVDETAMRCQWHVPAAHFLESWGDVRAFDGAISIIQPTIAPLYGGHSAYQLLNVLLGQPGQSDYDTVQNYWREQQGEDGFEAFWKQAVHDGVIPDTAFVAKSVGLQDDVLATLKASNDGNSGTSAEALTAVFRPHPTVWDGRFANNGWLQELPQPFTKLTWGNAALISPSTAAAYDLSDGQVVELSTERHRIELPVVRVPGQADGVVTLHFGCGRTQLGRVGASVGTDVYPLRETGGMWSTRVSLKKTDVVGKLPTTQHHFLMDGRDLVRSGTWDEYQSDPDHPPFMHQGHAHQEEQHSLYPSEHLKGEYQWGMSIDLTACTGCSACVIACQSENNIPIVGPQEVARGREMHWIRVDTYFEGKTENPAVHHQPVPCMHCEHAPCEIVCPVAATTHSEEGLNEMTYNRCIGTRYCSNNCPYKVRRFNFFDYQQEVRETPVLHLLQNPEVTVRSRGVMEKCTYCVQRINAARINAEMDDRSLQDGDVVTACQAVCPTQAIVFGDVSNPESAVSRQKSNALNYGLLEELNTRPRTTYLAALRNPHPLLREVDA